MEQFSEFAYVYDELNVNYDKETIISRMKALLCGKRDIVDLCCGTGDVAIALYKAGFKVTGIDISEDMLNVATEKAMEQGARIQFICEDARDFAVMKKADAVYSLTDGMNYLLGDKDLKKAFESVYNALNTDGLFIFDVSTAYKFENQLKDKTYTFDFDDEFVVWQSEYDPQSSICTMTITGFMRERKDLYSRFDEEHKQRAYSHGEIVNMLEGSGFELCGAYDAYSEELFNDKSERILYVAKKMDKR